MTRPRDQHVEMRREHVALVRHLRDVVRLAEARRDDAEFTALAAEAQRMLHAYTQASSEFTAMTRALLASPDKAT